ncbi:MAG: thiolase family protein [Dehalococcoidia bacterium]|nr:MAG: thiolase family protein [Dehalococcoidia bacterium]
MREAVVADAVRTPIARAHPDKGWFKDIRSDELSVIVIRELLKRTNVDPKQIEDVVLGCANQTGEQAMNVARYIAIMAGLPFEVAAQTINRQCASSMTAVHSAAQAIMTGCGDIFIAGGIESMTHLPEGAGADLNPKRFQFVDRSSSSMGLTAENLAEMYNISRQEQEEFASRSHRKAIAAQEEGRFKDEMVPVEITSDNGSKKLIDSDQNPRSYTSPELMAALEPISRQGGTITAATASPASDGAAAIMLASRQKSEEMGLMPKAKVLSMAVAGVDPKLMGLGIVPATRKALERAGLTIADIDLAEVNEAFAVVAMVAIRELGIDEEKVNPNGGAVALGHPMGCTGARLITTLVHEMTRRQARYGLAAMCVGMGQGAATILEIAS